MFDSDPSLESQVTKLDAARRQLETAIRLLFEQADEVAIHTLAYAAFGILKGVAQHRKERRVLAAAEELAAKDKAFWSRFNRKGNFFKHADTDPEGNVPEIPEEENEALISLGVEMYRDLKCPITPEIEAFYLWWRCIHFSPIEDVKEPFVSWINQNAPRLQSDRRSELLVLGQELYALFRSQRK